MARGYSKKKPETEEKKTLACYTIELDEKQMEQLEAWCDRHVWAFRQVAHARFAFNSPMDKVNLVAYKSGKVVIQGKGTEDFVQNVLEARITGLPRLGYEEFHHPEHYELHAGLDEAGKGDLFGPLVTACVIADGEMARGWVKEGLRDSKKMTDGSAIRFEKIIKKTKGAVVETAFCRMKRYNEIMSRPGANLNKLLAWLHARCLEDGLKKRRAPWGLLDQFSRKPLMRQYFKDKDFDLRERPRAESDPVVAAASVCARAGFIRQLRKLSNELGTELPKGAGAPAKRAAQAIVERRGPEALGEVAKLHFKTCAEVAGGVYERPAKK